MWVTLNMRSKNRKVGEIPVSTTEKDSCPVECPLKDTDCYARFGPLGMHWSKIGEGKRGSNWTAFCKRIGQFVAGQLWRHNQAGDLPQTKKGLINKFKSLQLARAAKHTLGWTYTHYNPLNSHNQGVIREMNKIGGLVVNLSADSLAEADQYAALNIGPVVVTLPKDNPIRGNKTPNGLTIVICPAQTQETMTCEQCRLCQVRDRKSVVGFLAHGIAQNRLSLKLEG